MSALDYVEPVNVVLEEVADPDDFNTQVLGNIRNAPRGVVAYAQVTASGQTVGALADLTGATVSFTAPGGRRYRITAHCCFTVTASETCVLWVTDGSNNQLQIAVIGLQDAGTLSTVMTTVLVAPSAGAVTYKLRVSGVGTVSNAASRPGLILVEDIGPA